MDNYDHDTSVAQFFLQNTILTHKLSTCSLSCCFFLQWIMDAIVCNGLGIYLGMKTLNYLSMKPYHWRGMWNIPSYRYGISFII